MKTIVSLMLALTLAAAGPICTAQPGSEAPPESQDVQGMIQSADEMRAEKSYRLAREAYEKILNSEMKLDAQTRAHVQVFMLDCLWRERSAPENLERANKELKRQIEDLPANSRWRAEAAESLGELRVQTGQYGTPPESLEPWLIALKYWGEASPQDEARPRYIRLNFAIAEYAMNNAGGEGYFPYPQGPIILRLGLLPPLPPPERAWEGDLVSWCLRNVMRISQAPADQARALYMLGLERARAANYDPKFKERTARWDKEAEDYLKQAAATEEGGEWAINAAWELAQFYEGRQRYVEAARTIESFLARYKREEIPFYEQALEMRKRITEPSADLRINEAFAPDSYICIDIQHRNIDRATLRLSRVRPEDLLDALQSARPDRPAEMFRALRSERVREQPVEGVTDDKKHEPHGKTLYLEPLPPGVYLAELDAVGTGSPNEPRRTLFRVSRLALAARSLEGADHVFVADAETGKPVAGARVWAVFKTEHDKPREWRRIEAKTGADGVARVERPAPPQNEPRNEQVDFYAEHEDQFATTQHWGWMGPHPFGGPGEAWAIYTETDRPAYRPGDVINWKAILRLREGDGYKLPAQEFVYGVVRDERGQVAAEGEFRVGEFGTIHGTLTPDRRVALGMLSLEILKRKEGESVGAQPLCRLEEYKLPEYKVSVEPPKQQVKFGAPVPFAVTAEYYFGGPVADAEVEILVHRRAFWPGWHPPRPYPWFYEEDGAGRMEWMPWIWPRIEPEQVILTKKLKTDAQGKARIEAGALTAEEIKQARDRGIWGYEFRVEARVVDASRREVRDSGSVKTALTALAAYLNPQRYLYLPGDPVRIDIKTLDPNNQPAAAEGFVTMYRRTWNPKRLDAKGQPEAGYDDTKMLVRPAVTDTKEGAATVEFAPDEAGCYLFRFETRDKFGEPVKSETVVFVADRNTRQTGYRSGGVTIVTDKDTYERGETAHVLLTVRRPGAAVWFGIETETVRELRVVPIEGTVKMVDVPVGADCQPNFYVTAAAMFDYAAFTDTRRLVVPPKEQFLAVTIRAAKEEFKPGEKARVEIEVKDHAGRPVATELSLGIADAAVWAIQGDLGEDIRKAFWSHLRGLNFNISSSANTYTMRLRPRPGKPGEYESADESQAQDKSGMSWGGGRGGSFREEGIMMKGMPMMRGVLSMNAAEAPMAAAPASAKMAREMVADMDAVQLKEPDRVRTNFSATALWLPSLLTDAEGKAGAEVTFPDSLTSWKLTARAADKATRVGEVRREARTTKPLLVRPQGPRYFIQGDAVVLSAVVNNNTSEPLPVEVAIDLGGLALVNGIPAKAGTPEQISSEPVASEAPKIRIMVPAHGQRRVDWRVAAGAPGEARIKTTALSAIDSDAVERTFPIHEYGIEQFTASSTALRGLPEIMEGALTLNLPANRRAGSERLTLTIEPTLARSMVDALDYLAKYPYGCVEQTVSRFVPAVTTARTLRQLGIYKPDLEAKLPEMIQAGLSRLADFQNPDGGWGWWRDERSDLYMSAYVLQGLGQALRADVAVNMDMVQRGERFLTERLIQAKDQPDLAAFMLYALALARSSSATLDSTKAAYERLWAQREKLNPYARALFTIACTMTAQNDWASTLGRNLRNGMVQDKENGTVHWGSTGVFHHWSDSAVEATAYTLRALLMVEPESELVDQAMLWLVRNRKGNRWESTKDSAAAVRALSDFVRAMSEDKPDWRAEIEVNGRRFKTLSVRPEEVWTFNGEVTIPASELRDGENRIVVRRIGRGALYATAWLTCFTREEQIKPAGNEVFVKRRFFRTRQEPTLAGPYKTVREEVTGTSGTLKSGDRVQVQLEIEAKNNYEYLVIEDLKAAGMEPTALQSGGTWGGGLSAHRELRDEKTVFFITSLPQGKHSLSYELRAEIPGVFAALPTLMHAMYVPEIRANSANAKVGIED